MTTILPGEPELEVDDIQAHVLIGFGSTEQAIGAFTGDDLPALGAVLADWAARGRFRSARDLMPRKGLNARRFLAGADIRHDRTSGPWLAAAVSKRLLAACGVPHQFDDLWFSAESMLEVPELGDRLPAGGGQLGDDWEVGNGERPVDVLLVVGAARASAADEILDWFLAAAGPTAREVYREELLPIEGSLEHFGFRDGISQPGVLGLVGGEPFEAFRQEDATTFPEGLPGQDLIWPGEFLFGYPSQGPVPRVRAPIRRLADADTDAIARNGSYLVFRRLLQNVAAFRAFCDAKAAEIRHLHPEADGDWLATRFVGRTTAGGPLVSEPGAPFDPDASNDFRFDGDPMTSGCPLAAHIRKVNPRRGPSDQQINPRIIRRGAPFGRQHEPGEMAPPGRGRGLVFLSYQRSIDQQFNTVIVRWMNDPSNPSGGGHDMLMGQPGRGESRHFTVPGEPDDTEVVAGPSEAWVHTTGGAFLFAPSISTLTRLGNPTEAR
ncbi:MAG TPA: hypothetical protein VNA20_10605 [Frankiaceae bacterium]|nr:hypothetical protein [Frankiaceae bacterium]